MTRTAVKTDNSERTVKISTSMSQSLVIARNLQATRGFSRDEDFVAASENGRPMCPGYLYKTFQKLVIRYNEAIDASPTATEDEKTLAKLPVIRFHDLRHSHATLLLAQGVSTKIVSERLGHSRTSFTQDTYQHILPGMQDEAADLIDSAPRKGKYIKSYVCQMFANKKGLLLKREKSLEFAGGINRTRICDLFDVNEAL